MNVKDCYISLYASYFWRKFFRWRKYVRYVRIDERM